MNNRLFSMRSLSLAAALSTALGAASSAMAYQHQGQSEAVDACFTNLRQTLNIGNYDRIDPEYGMKRLGAKTYAFYLNVSVRDNANSERVPMKVYCESEGFARVRAFAVETGRWAYQTGEATAEGTGLAINHR